ncbi:MAG: DUF3553 domain-containing protein [Planctomycetes bacterium]|nr:DUF3553 domain-containing protein [Planctomycetota bacterium]
MDLLSDLNEPQQQAIAHGNGPLLVLAGAGSGKTRVITRRVAYLIQQGIAPWHVLAITFTNKAAKEMAERIAALGTPGGVTACTFHSLCARLLREFANEAGLPANYSIYDAVDQKRLAKAAIETAGLAGGAANAAKFLSDISRAKMRLKTADALADEAGNFADQQLAKVYKVYEKALRAAGALDFDDLLMRMAFLLRDHPEVRRLLGERYSYILIDEYQDTNHPQYLIAHGIAMDHKNICATGDPDQSIYSWRGANVANILEFESDYPGVRVIRLEENYRSTASILAAADRLIGYNRLRKAKNLFTRRQGGQDVTVVNTTDEHAEALEVVRRVHQWVARGCRHDEIAIFYRLNSLSRVLEDALRRAGMPYRIARGVAFYNRKEIKDVLGYLRLINNPSDNLACERIVNVPARGIGAITMKRIHRFAEAHGLSLFEATRQARQIGDLGNAAAEKVAKFVTLMEQLDRLATGTVKDLLEAVLKRTGLENELKVAGGEEQAELANVAELVTAAAEFDEENPDATLTDYLNQVALVSDMDHFAGGSGAVTLMTLHAAKGLEFPRVIMVGCEEGLLPFHRAAESEAQQEEERRLCFVGMTRAKDQLVLTHANYRSVRGVRQRQVRSQFLWDLSGEHVVQVDLSETMATQPACLSNDSPKYDRGPLRRHKKLQAVQQDEFFDADTDQIVDLVGPSGVRAGSRVRHPKFGCGQVKEVGQSGPHTRVVVDFDRLGRKVLILQFAKLQVLR